jgi:hypothetical protein
MIQLKDAAALLGKQVRVVLEDGPDPAGIIEGKLVSFADSGEVNVVDEMGFVHYCWPMLYVEELT